MEEQKPIENTNNNSTKSDNRTKIFIVLLVIIIIAQAVKIYLDHQESVKQENLLMDTEEQLAVNLQKLSDIREELEQKIQEIDSLGGDIADLEKAKAEVEAELARTRKRDRQQIANLTDRVEGYQELLKAKDEEIAKLKEVNESLLTENTTLKNEKNELSSTIREVNEEKSKLESKVALASQLRAENIEILAVNSRGREREMPAKSRQIDKLKVTFNIAENEVAPIEGKNILIRIVDDKGQVIFDVAKGSGTFMYDNKEEFYTANQEILFDNSRQRLSFEYDKGSDYESGIYLLEVYTDDYKMGSKQFEVK